MYNTAKRGPKPSTVCPHCGQSPKCRTSGVCPVWSRERADRSDNSANVRREKNADAQWFRDRRARGERHCEALRALAKAPETKAMDRCLIKWGSQIREAAYNASRYKELGLLVLSARELRRVGALYELWAEDRKVLGMAVPWATWAKVLKEVGAVNAISFVFGDSLVALPLNRTVLDLRVADPALPL